MPEWGYSVSCLLLFHQVKNSPTQGRYSVVNKCVEGGGVGVCIVALSTSPQYRRSDVDVHMMNCILALIDTRSTGTLTHTHAHARAHTHTYTLTRVCAEWDEMCVCEQQEVGQCNHLTACHPRAVIRQGNTCWLSLIVWCGLNFYKRVQVQSPIISDMTHHQQRRQ